MLSNKTKQTLFLHTEAQALVLGCALFRRKGSFCLAVGEHSCEQQQIPPGTSAEVTGTTTGSTSCPRACPCWSHTLPSRCKRLCRIWGTIPSKNIPELWCAELKWPHNDSLLHGEPYIRIPKPRLPLATKTTQIWALIDAVIYLGLSWECCCRKERRLRLSAYKSGRDNIESYNITFSEP